MENNGTAPIRLGTLYIQDKDNSNYNYVVGCLELYDSPGGVQINFEELYTNAEGKVVAKYVYTYNDLNPITTYNINSYYLEIVYPTFNNGEPVLPDFIEASNVNNPAERKVGKINRTPDVTATDPIEGQLFYPRSVVLANTPEAPNSALQQFIFIIADTSPDCELAMNAANLGTTINCEPVTTPGLDNGPHNASAALVAIDTLAPPAIISLLHNGQSYESDINYAQITYFHYEGEDDQPLVSA